MLSGGIHYVVVMVLVCVTEAEGAAQEEAIAGLQNLEIGTRRDYIVDETERCEGWFGVVGVVERDKLEMIIGRGSAEEDG